MNVAEIQRQLSAAVTEYKRARDTGENEAMETALGNVRNLTTKLENERAIETAEREAASNQMSEQQQREINNNFSWCRFLLGASSERGLSGFEAEMAQEAVREASQMGLTIKGFGIPSAVLNARAAAGQNASTEAAGKNLIQEMPLTYLETLRSKLVLAQLGARYLSGLVGTVPFVSSTDPTISWKTEADPGTTEKTEIDKKSLSPNRMTVTMAYTKDLLIQSSADVERMVMEKLVAAHAKGLETAAINGSGTAGQPRGILNTIGIGSVVMGENGANINWKSVVGLESAITAADADLNALAYLTNSKVIGEMKTIEKAAGTARYIMENGETNGLKVGVTNIVPANLTKGSATIKCSAMICGDFSQLLLGQWGGLDLVIDPYTLKKTSEIEVTMAAWHDIMLTNPKCFAAIKDITLS